MSGNDKEISSKYFKRLGVLVLLLHCVLYSVLYLAIYHRDVVPYKSLGPVGSFYHYISYTYPSIAFYVFYYFVVAHAIEGFQSMYIAHGKGVTDTVALMKWFVQTMITGRFSVVLIKAYEPKTKNK
ncbi:unnamed protein product [Clavelina lepadiformis]|uniref:Transmembrane protein 254 n=1 Tax=Clavelina lepadiformis TaxID=159417 RepID=A0ABP0G6Q5_CLALP